jgi:hypothetical protein
MNDPAAKKMKLDGSTPLDPIVNQFVAGCDDADLALHIGDQANTLCSAAWEGTLFAQTIGICLPLKDAIDQSHEIFDECVMHFTENQAAEILSVEPDFDVVLMTSHIESAFTRLKTYDFGSMGTVDFDHIQAVLAAGKETWFKSQHKLASWILQEFFSQLSGLSVQLKKKANRRLPNDESHFHRDSAQENAPAPVADGVTLVGGDDDGTFVKGDQVVLADLSVLELNGMRAQVLGSLTKNGRYPVLVLEGDKKGAKITVKPEKIKRWEAAMSGAAPPAAPRLLPKVYKREHYVDWGRCLPGIPNFARFGSTPEESFLSPRMAALIFNAACMGGNYDYRDAEGDCMCPPNLPRIARPFWKKVPRWRRNLIECYRRIACRLYNGLPPSPNCTGEEIAFHNMMSNMDDDIDENIESVNYSYGLTALPVDVRDTDCHGVADAAVEDTDVLMLYAAGDDGDPDTDDDDDADLMDPGTMASFLLGPAGTMMGTAHLHPQDWFIAFRNESFGNHIAMSQEGTGAGACEQGGAGAGAGVVFGGGAGGQEQGGGRA